MDHEIVCRACYEAEESISHDGVGAISLARLGTVLNVGRLSIVLWPSPPVTGQTSDDGVSVRSVDRSSFASNACSGDHIRLVAALRSVKSPDQPWFTGSADSTTTCACRRRPTKWCCGGTRPRWPRSGRPSPV